MWVNRVRWKELLLQSHPGCCPCSLKKYRRTIVSLCELWIWSTCKKGAYKSNYAFFLNNQNTGGVKHDLLLVFRLLAWSTTVSQLCFTVDKQPISPDEEILPQHDLKHSASKYLASTYEQLPHQQKCLLREQRWFHTGLEMRYFSMQLGKNYASKPHIFSTLN